MPTEVLLVLSVGLWEQSFYIRHLILTFKKYLSGVHCNVWYLCVLMTHTNSAGFARSQQTVIIIAR